MGGCISQNGGKQMITMASLNYSGVQESPFQFYDTEDQDEVLLSKLFQKNCGLQYKKFYDPKFKWAFAKMDKEWHDRYSPIYNKQCGIKKNQLMTRQQFEQQWQKMYKQTFKASYGKIYGKIPEAERQKAVEIDHKQCKIFDFIVYKSIIEFLYKVDKIESGMDAQKYRIFQNMKFTKPFLNQQLKINYTLKCLKQNQIDVLFLQQANLNLIKAITQLYNNKMEVIHKIHKNCTSAILISKQKFGDIKDFKKDNQKFLLQYSSKIGDDPEKRLFFNDDSVFQVVGKTIFFSIHLSSKKQINPGQITKMNQVLGELLGHFPQYNFIIGSDLNGPYSTDTQISVGTKNVPVFVFPNHKFDVTALKKRTMLQVQKNKANELNDGVKDYFVSNLKLQNTFVQTIKGVKIEKGKNLLLLPNSEHPYDHYLLFATMQFNKNYFTNGS